MRSKEWNIEMNLRNPSILYLLLFPRECLSRYESISHLQITLTGKGALSQSLFAHSAHTFPLSLFLPLPSLNRLYAMGMDGGAQALSEWKIQG